jgi:chromate transporter
MPQGSPLEVFAAALRLGLTSFGGPVAHIGYFRAEYVQRRGWVDEATYADLVALCQFLPGPASSKVGIALGILRAGLLGGLAAWIGFTLPSALALTLFAFGVGALGGADPSASSGPALSAGSGLAAGILHGLKVVAVAVVAQAVWAMWRNLAPDRERATIALLAAAAAVTWPSALGQLATIAVAAVVGRLVLTRVGSVTPESVSSVSTVSTPAVRVPFGRRTAVAAWAAYFGLLALLPLASAATGSPAVAVLDTFYRVGSLVFGGGHVILPLLQAEVVPPGWVTTEQFVAGYGAAQAVPGPLFTFSAYLGATLGGWSYALLALVAIFVPSFLLVVGSLPFWDALRARPAFQDALRGVNAAVVGLLLAALYQPVWTSAVRGPADFVLALLALGLLALWRVPPWLVVLLAAGAGALLGLLE